MDKGKRIVENPRNDPVSPITGQPIPRNGGRPKGVGNKSTETVKRAIAALLENNAPKIEQWIEEVHQKDGAKDALKIYLDFAEFVTPKLTRAAVDHSSEDGSMTPQVFVNFTKPESPHED